jgi:hypothetical protein
MDDPETTPEWCELREDMIKDAKEISITPKRLDR